MLSTSPTICAMAVSEPWAMSTVPQNNVVLPSPAMVTLATEVVGEITALMATASPRPRRMVPVPRSNGLPPIIRAAACSSTLSTGPARSVLARRAGGGTAPLALDVLAVKIERVDLQRPRHHVGVGLVGPHQLR